MLAKQRAVSHVHKKLISSAMVHTPGIFRAMQNDYGIRGKPRDRAIYMLSNIYQIDEEEAESLLSGRIAVEIDEEQGTVSYEL
jgi:hypothetical protein